MLIEKIWRFNWTLSMVKNYSVVYESEINLMENEVVIGLNTHRVLMVNEWMKPFDDELMLRVRL